MGASVRLLFRDATSNVDTAGPCALTTAASDVVSVIVASRITAAFLIGDGSWEWKVHTYAGQAAVS